MSHCGTDDNCRFRPQPCSFRPLDGLGGLGDESSSGGRGRSVLSLTDAFPSGRGMLLSPVLVGFALTPADERARERQLQRRALDDCRLALA